MSGTRRRPGATPTSRPSWHRLRALLDAPNPRDVLGGDAQCPPLLFGLVVGEPEMHDAAPDDYVRCPDLEPLLSLEPRLSHQFGEQVVADGTVVAVGVDPRVALRY